MKLSAARVREIVQEVLVDRSKPVDGTNITVQGVVREVEFSLHRLKTHEDEIRKFLSELDPRFRDGFTFLNGLRHERRSPVG